MPQQKIEIPIPEDLKPAQRLELGDLIVEHIVERTMQGKDKNNNPFKKYSKSYAESLDFKIAGKSRSRPNLQLSGDMLASLELLSQQKGKLKVGFPKGDEVNARAEGHITGILGKSRGHKRDFLGLQKSKLNELIRFVRETSER